MSLHSVHSPRFQMETSTPRKWHPVGLRDLRAPWPVWLGRLWLPPPPSTAFPLRRQQRVERLFRMLALWQQPLPDVWLPPLNQWPLFRRPSQPVPPIQLPEADFDTSR